MISILICPSHGCEIDIKAGINAGCKNALIGEGAYGQTVTVPSLEAFVEQYLNDEEEN